MPIHPWARVATFFIVGYEAFYSFVYVISTILRTIHFLAENFINVYNQYHGPEWVTCIVDFHTLHKFVYALFLGVCVYMFVIVATHNPIYF